MGGWGGGDFIFWIFVLEHHDFSSSIKSTLPKEVSTDLIAVTSWVYLPLPLSVSLD